MISYKKVIAVLLVLVLIALRFVYLDQDAPAYMIGGICQEDEIYYVLGAVNDYNKDNGRVIEGFETIRGEGLMLYGSHLVYWSLKIFGNNYWGLRIPVVLISLLSIFLIYDILRRLNTDALIRYLALLYMLSDFYFFLFSRYQTPQIFSIFSISICLWLYFKYGLTKFKGPFLLGMFCFVAISFVYMYNLFIIPAFGLISLFAAYKQKTLKPVLFYIVGLVAGLFIYVVSLYAIGSSPMEIINLLVTHGGGIEGIKNETHQNGILVIIKQLYAKSIQLPLTNLFRYNLSVLVLFMFSLPFVFYQAVKIKSERYQVYACILLLVFLQSFFVISYPFKKWVVIIPLVVLVIADSYAQIFSFYEKLSSRTKFLTAFYLALIGFLCFMNFKINNSEAYWAPFGYGYYVNTEGWFNVLNLCLAILLLVLITFRVFKRKAFLQPVYVLLSLFGLILVSKVCISESSFFAREGFTKASSYLNHKGVLTDACYASQLYTSSTPAMGCYADKLNFGERYYTIADSLFKSGRGDFRIIKVMPSQEGKQLVDTNFIALEKIPMKYYSFHVFKYKRAN